jgi:hypothetical protein
MIPLTTVPLAMEEEGKQREKSVACDGQQTLCTVFLCIGMKKMLKKQRGKKKKLNLQNSILKNNFNLKLI